MDEVKKEETEIAPIETIAEEEYYSVPSKVRTAHEKALVSKVVSVSQKVLFLSKVYCSYPYYIVLFYLGTCEKC